MSRPPFMTRGEWRSWENDFANGLIKLAEEIKAGTVRVLEASSQSESELMATGPGLARRENSGVTNIIVRYYRDRID
jgi:hypothetical protein